MTAPASLTMDVTRHVRRRERWGLAEIAFWLALVAILIGFPARAALINEMLVAGLFALSLDLVLGLAGVVSLGHAAFFGLGAYTAGILAAAGWNDPLLGLLAACAPAALVGLITAPLLLRGADLTRLMVTMGVALSLGELANKNEWLTGGADGLNFTVAPLFGLFSLGSMGVGPRNAALFSLAVLFVLFAFARRLRASPFGVSLEGLRENRLRAGALGVDTSRRLVAIYALSATYAGVAGALSAETTQIVSLDLFDFHRSADVMLMLIIGGAGWLYGGVVGAGVFIGVRDVVSAATPEYWEFWIGLMLVVLVLTGRARIAAWFGR